MRVSLPRFGSRMAAPLLPRQVYLLLLSSTALTACGGGGGGGGGPATSGTASPPAATPADDGQPPEPPVPTGMARVSGRVFDGPVVGAQVFLDINRDGRIDDGDREIGVTDGKGAFSATVSADLAALPLIVRLDGATDIGDPADPRDDRPTAGTWRAAAPTGNGLAGPDGFRIISPVTELMARTGLSSRDIAGHFNLPAHVNFETMDPYSEDIDPLVQDAILKVSRAVNDMLPQIPVPHPADPLPLVELPDATPWRFTLSSSLAGQAENTVTTGRKLADLIITDDGKGVNTPFLQSPNGHLFRLQRDGGDRWSLWLRPGARFDFEDDAPPVAVIGLRSTGLGPAPEAQRLQLTITDLPEAPVINQAVGRQTLRLDEGRSVAADTGYRFRASDDDGDPVILSVNDARFEVVGGSLRVKAGQNFDFEGEPVIRLTVTARDPGGLEHSRDVTVRVSNVNEAPDLSVTGRQTLTLNEGISVVGDTGFAVGADDPDAGDHVTYAVDDHRFEIVGGRLRVKAGQRFDFETEPVVIMTVTATDRGQLTDSQRVTVAITDIDEAPTAIRVTNIHGPMPENTIVSRNTRLATIEVDDPDHNPAFRDWNVILSSDHAQILEIREVGGIIGLYFRRDMAPDFEMPTSWTIPVGIAGTPLSTDIVLPVTNRDEPTTGHIAVGGAPHVGRTLHVDLSGLVDPDGVPDFTANWYRIGSNQILSGGKHFTPREAGDYRVEISAFSVIDGAAQSTKYQFSATVTVTDPPVPAAATLTETLRIYENHPNDKPLYDAAGDGVFTLTPGHGDNAMFRVTADGRIMFAPSADHPRLDHENPADLGSDNLYDLQLIRTFGAGQTQTINLRVTVQDIPYEQLYFERNTQDMVRTHYELRPRDLAQDDVPTISVQQLILGSVWHMPKTGPLTLTYSLLIPGKISNFTYSRNYLTTSEKIAAIRRDLRQAFDEFERAANLKFIEVDESADLRGDIRVVVPDGRPGHGRSSGPGLSYAQTGNENSGSLIHFAAGDAYNPAWFYATIVHEIGHTMGLGHPFHRSLQGWPGNPRLLRSASSVMSYSRSKDGYIDGALTPADIRALQFLYGRAGTDFEGVESRLIRPHQTFNINPDRNAVVMDEGTSTAQELTRFRMSDGSFGNERLVITTANRDMFELRYNAGDDSWSLWLLGGQQLDFETAPQGRQLVRLGLDQPAGKILLQPLYFLVNLRDVDEKPSEMTLSSQQLESSLDENQLTIARKLADITFTDDALGTNTPWLRENPGNLFELRQDGDGDWALWLRGGVTPDFETLRQQGETRSTVLEAVIATRSTGTGDREPADQRYGLTLDNVIEFPAGNRLALDRAPQLNTRLEADTSGITSGDGEVSFTNYRWIWQLVGTSDGVLSTDSHFTPTRPGRYALQVTATVGEFSRDYTILFIVPMEPQQSAGSQGQAGQAGQAPPFEALDNGLDDPVQDSLQDLLPLSLDVV